MKKTISTRFKITATGKVLRRAMGQCHFRSKKRATQLRRKKIDRKIGDLSNKIVKKYL